MFGTTAVVFSGRFVIGDVFFFIMKGSPPMATNSSRSSSRLCPNIGNIVL